MIGTAPTLRVQAASMFSVRLATLADLDELVRHGEPLYRALGFHEQEERAVVKRL